jgi:hypothetical protein
MTSLRLSTLTFAALAPAVDSMAGVSRAFIMRCTMPTLKNEMNFSCWSISRRMVVADSGHHFAQRTLSQSSVIKPEKRHGLEASGIVFKNRRGPLRRIQTRPGWVAAIHFSTKALNSCALWRSSAASVDVAIWTPV